MFRFSKNFRQLLQARVLDARKHRICVRRESHPLGNEEKVGHDAGVFVETLFDRKLDGDWWK